MLTPKQRQVRETGVGASESSALLGLNPYREAIDVWMDKPTRSRPPLAAIEESSESGMGHAFEDALRYEYVRRTGKRVQRRRITYRHPKYPHVLASPDGLHVDEDAGFEAKLVGSNMAHHWVDGPPDYVVTQAMQCMAVTGRSRWDVVASIGGTHFEIFPIHKDPETEANIVDAIEAWWATHIDGDEPPPIIGLEARQRYLRARYPGSAKSKLRVDTSEEAAELISAYVDAKREYEDLERVVKSLRCDVEEFIANGYGIEGPWGKVIAPRMPGKVNWEALAAELRIPPELMEKYRGRPYRQIRHYAPSEARATKRGRAA